MSRAAFVLVEGGKLHRNPSFEDCNVDDAAVINRFKQLEDVPRKNRVDPCAKCEPLGDPPKGYAKAAKAAEKAEVSAPPTEPNETPDPGPAPNEA